MLRKSKDELRMKYVAQRHSKKQESFWATELGAKKVKSSGAGCGIEKGDVRFKGVLRLENKCTQAKSFRLTTEMVQKIEDAALQSGELPAIEIEFIDSKGNILYSVAVVPTYVLEHLIDKDVNYGATE